MVKAPANQGSQNRPRHHHKHSVYPIREGGAGQGSRRRHAHNVKPEFKKIVTEWL